MEDANDEIIAEFISESRDMLDRVEPLLIELEGNSEHPDAETLAVIFRCFHSFKGTASFIGLNVTANLAHSAESLLDLYRRGCGMQPLHVDLLCQTLDALRAILGCVETEQSDQTFQTKASVLIAGLDAIVAELKRDFAPSTHNGRDKANSVEKSSALQASVHLDTVAPGSVRPSPDVSAAERDSFLVPAVRVSLLSGVDMDEAMRALTAELLPKFVAEGEEHLTLVEATLMALETEAAEFAQNDPELDPSELWTDIYVNA